MGTSASAAAPTPLDRWPLVGRSDELTLAHERIAHGGSIVIAGAPGVGKTRLARELLASADAEGRTTEWAVATLAGRAIPFGALAHLVAAEEREPTLGSVIERLRQHGDRPFVLGIDDAHLLDDRSAVLVHQLVLRGAAAVVLTARSGEPAPDPILGLWKDDLAVRVELQALSRAEAVELLAAVLGGPMDGAAVHLLWELSRGNVLFLRQLVNQGLESGALRRDELWHWVGPLQPGQRLHDVVGARIGALDDDERDALELLALGEPVPLACVGALVPPGLVTRLERRGLVHIRREPAGIQVRLAHPLFGEVVRTGAPALRVADIRRRLADAFQAHAPLEPGVALRVATWRADIEDRSDPGALLRGARRAWALGELGLVERLARLSLDANADFEAGYLLGKALVGQGRFEEAVTTWRAAEELASSDVQRAALAAALAHLLLWGLGRPEDADAAVRRAERLVEHGDGRQKLDSVRALLQAITAGTAGQRIEHATALLRDPELPDRLRGSATLAAVTAWTEAGRLDVAARAATDAIAIAEDRSGGASATMLRTCLADALWPAGRLDEAEALATDGYTQALEHADHRRGIWCRLLGSIALVRGHGGAATLWLEEAELTLREQQDEAFLFGVLVRLGMAAALLGDLDRASRALEGRTSSDALFAQGWDLELPRARAWLSMAQGNRSAAARHADDGAVAAARREHRTVEAFALHDLARFGEAGSAVDRLGALARSVDGALVRAMAAHAEGLARHDGVALDAAAGAFAELGCHLYAAEAASVAAATHREAGRRSSAAASASRAHAWIGRCEGARTPALALADHDDHLTRREREVAALAAHGLSDVQIAEQLYISVRTVHAHLHAAYAKLDVPGRGALAAVLGTEAPRLSN